MDVDMADAAGGLGAGAAVTTVAEADVLETANIPPKKLVDEMMWRLHDPRTTVSDLDWISNKLLRLAYAPEDYLWCLQQRMLGCMRRKNEGKGE